MDEILKFFPHLEDVKIRQFEQLYALYSEWNTKINVISRKDIENLYEHHVLHSLAIHRFLTFSPGSKILDVGTGGGFPGIPLAIMQPECRFTLIDSTGKKTRVAQSVADSIGLKNVKVYHERAEKIKDKFDFIVSRAVMPLPKFTKLTLKKLAKTQKNALPNGIIYLKGGQFDNELQALDFVHTDVFDITDYFDLPYFQGKKIVYITH